MTKQDLFASTARGLWDCDALILVYDLTNEKSFQAICKFCRRCELENVSVAPGKTLPCLVVGTKYDRRNHCHVEDGYKLAKRLGGKFIQVSSRTGEGLDGLLEEAAGPVIDARIRLMQECEETLGDAIRRLMAWTAKLTKKRPEMRPELAKADGAPPRWTMRPIIEPTWQVPSRSSESSETSLPPCPPEYQIPVDYVEPAATDWAPRFDFIGRWRLSGYSLSGYSR